MPMSGGKRNHEDVSDKRAILSFISQRGAGRKRLCRVINSLTRAKIAFAPLLRVLGRFGTWYLRVFPVV